MIIFDLDGTLANCEHRRHLVDPIKSGYSQMYNSPQCFYSKRWLKFFNDEPIPREFVPDWDAFYEACDKDTPNIHVCWLFRILSNQHSHVQIWSGRSASVADKTLKWLQDHYIINTNNLVLKMRPIGDTTPDDQLKERWLDEALAEGKQIEMVFDDRNKVVAMWRRRGITCLQVAAGEF